LKAPLWQCAFLGLTVFRRGDIPVFFFSRFDLSMCIMNIQLATLPNPLPVSGCSIFKKLQKTTSLWSFFTGKKQQSRTRQQTAIGGVIVMADCLAANTLQFYSPSSVSSLPLLN